MVALLVILLTILLVSYQIEKLIQGRFIRVHKERSRRSGYIYFYRGAKENWRQVKIGRTGNLDQRLSAARTSNPYGLHVYGVLKVRDDVWAEGFIHRKYANQRLFKNNEWFRLTLNLMIYIYLIRDAELTNAMRIKYRQ